ncbi:MAG: FHA domain-containing protein [Bacteriovoracaceae bacterium]|nr:FHA domain-containing protein [Bacteriovoracaceae bacterium]
MKLIFHTMNDGVQEFEVDKNTVIIGRGSNCDVILKIEGISRQHCQIEATPRGEFIITDLGSTNGVLIDNQRITANEPTKYSAYLPLAIGSVPHVTIETANAVQEERVISQSKKAISLELDVPTKKKNSRLTGKSPLKGLVKIEKQKTPPTTLIIIALLAVIGFSYFFFQS